jgi:hypothetical protein
METITLYLAITFFGSSVEGVTCRTDHIYFDDHKEFLCVSNTETVDDAGNVSISQDVYIWDGGIIKYDVDLKIWDTFPPNPREYTVKKLDLWREVETTFIPKYGQGDVEGVMTFTKVSRRGGTSNLLSLDCPATTVFKDEFILKVVPHIENYNIAALKRKARLTSWYTESGKSLAFWTGFTDYSFSVDEDKLYTRETKHSESSAIVVSKETIGELKARYLPDGR